MRLAFILLLLPSLAFAQASRSAPPTFFGLSRELFFSALKEADGRPSAISKDRLKSNAVALYRFLAGRGPRADEKLVVFVQSDPDRSPKTEEEFVVFVGYDNGLTGGGCDFHFRHGNLASIVLVRGE